MNSLKHITHRFFRRFLIGFLLLTSVAICLGQFAGGQGTETDPWQIRTAEHLNNVRNYIGSANSNKYFIQTANIDLGEAPYNLGEGWVPIGTGSASTQSFQASYNGNGHIITGLTINRPNSHDQALFGYTGGEGIIKDLGLTYVNVRGNERVAALVARMVNYSRIERCYATGTVIGSDYVGGINGYKGCNSGSSTFILDSYSTVNVTATGGTNEIYAGGISAYNYRGQVRRCYAIGRITVDTPSDRAAAVVGYRGSTAGTLSQLYWNRETTGRTAGVGNDNFPGHTTAQLLQQAAYEGFGFFFTWRIDAGRSYAYFQWQGNEADAHNLPLLPPTNLQAAAANMTVNLQWNAPPNDFGIPQGYNVYRDNVRVNDDLIQVTNYQDTGLQNWIRYHYSVTAVFNDRESMHSNRVSAAPFQFAGGNGTEQNPYLVETAEQLNGIRFYLTSHYRQAAHIDLGAAPWNVGEGWLPIGNEDLPFRGSYNGSHYRTANLTINRNANYQSLFGYVTSSILSNIGLSDVNISGGNYTGGIAGHSGGSTFTECYVKGSVSGTRYLGGLVGYGDNISILRSFTNGSITGTRTDTYVGGVIGYKGENSSLTDSYSTMDVQGVQSYIGGLIAYNHSGNVIRCYSAGRVTATDPVSDIGGMIGSHLTGFITTSYWDVENSQQAESAGGEGRVTRQMIYPTYDQVNTYLNWDIMNVWAIDENSVINNNYPILQYQIVPLSAPDVDIEIREILEQKYVYLSWEPVTNARSYRIYSSPDPYRENWGEPIAILGADVNHYSERIISLEYKGFYVTASTEAPPEE